MNANRLTVTLLTLSVLTSVNAAEQTKTGRTQAVHVQNFTLQDYRGKQHQLSDFQDASSVVLVFLGTECPLVRLYGPRLEQLSQQYRTRSVVFLGINSNRQDSLTDIAAYARRHGITFPILKDTRNQLADAVNAQRTPSVAVLDSKRQVIYQGRIDDQYGVGYARETPTQTYLVDAIDATLAGRKPALTNVAAEGCLIGRVRKVDHSSTVTYGEHIAPILNQHCVQCHRDGEIAPFALTSFDEVAGWSEMIREVVRDQRMPPWHASPKHGRFSNSRGLSDNEKGLINRWVLAGAPAGDLSSLPELSPKASGWQLESEPDVVVSMNKSATVPAEGAVEYQYYQIDPGFDEDKWIRAAEVVPGARDVVHHILVFVTDGNEPLGQFVEGGGSFLAAYVPGLRTEEYPRGMAKLIPAGSKLVFQMHYTPNGTERTDRSSIGLYFADEIEIDHVVTTQEVINDSFRIPAGAGNHRVEASSRKAPPGMQLLSLMPHMHLRGKSFRYEAVLPGGRRKTLLDVPAYDFNWQTAYRFQQPMKLPAGTRMHCVAHFDNSAGNLNNPAPDEIVRWGEQTWDEMMIGYFDIALPREGASSRIAELRAIMKEFDRNEDGQIQRSEVPQNLQRIFTRLDSNKDDRVNFEELKRLPKNR